MKRISSIAYRLKEYRDITGDTLAEVSQKTGIPAQTLNRYELGQRAPKIDVAVQIAESLSLNPLWVQGYDVKMENELTPASESELGTLDARLKELLASADDDLKRTMIAILERTQKG